MSRFVYALVIAFVSGYAALAAETDIQKIERLSAEADSLHSIGRTDSAAIIGAEAIKVAEAAGYNSAIVSTHASQGVYLRSLGKVDEAMKEYDAALEIVTSGAFRDNPDQEAIESIATLYINLSAVNLDMQQKEDAVRNANMAAEWFSKCDDAATRSVGYGVAGSVLTACGDYDGAIKYQVLAYDDALKADDPEAAFRAAAYTMLIADRQGDKVLAEQWRTKCGELMPQIESMMARLVYYQAECSICLTGNNPRGALVWFNKILSLEGIENLPFVMLDCYNNMHVAYADLDDYQNAYKTLLKGSDLTRELWDKDKSDALQELTVKYETKEKELALARSEASRSLTLMWFFAALGVLLVVGIIFVVYVGRQRQHRLRQYISGLENERRRMSLELHDGVCNDLLAIEMQIHNGIPTEQTADMIDTCRQAVRRISHELMPPEFTYADLDEVLRYFVDKQAEAAGDKIEMTYSSCAEGSDWKTVPDATALEVYRIVQEAVGNAVKHSGAKRIDVSATLTGKDLTASVCDDGTYKFSDKRGLGLESMRRRAQSVGGNLEVRVVKDSGTEVLLTVKIQ